MGKLRSFLTEKEMYSLNNYSISLINSCDNLTDEAQMNIITIVNEFGITTEDDLRFMVKHADKSSMMLRIMREGKGWFYVINKIYHME